VINGAMLWLADALLDKFRIDGFCGPSPAALPRRLQPAAQALTEKSEK